MKIVSVWEKDRMGMLFCKEGSFSSIVTAFKVKGLNYLYLSQAEIEQIYRDIYGMFDGLPTSAGKRRWYFQLYGHPDFDFDDVYKGMDDLIFVNEYREVFEKLVGERTDQLKDYVSKKEVMRYRLYFIIRCYPGSSFVDNLRDVLRSEEQIFTNEMDTLDEAIEDFERIEAQLAVFLPERVSGTGVANLIRRHYGLDQIKGISDDKPIVPQIFTREIEFHPDHTKVIIDGAEKDIYLRTYTANSYHSLNDFVGLQMCDFPGDFSITQSFTIPDNRRMIFMLKARVVVKEIIGSIPVLKNWVDKIKEQKYVQYIFKAISDIHETGQKRVKLAFHLTLRSNTKKDKRTRTKVRNYFNELSFEELYENSRHDMVNIASATPFSLSKGTEHTLKRFMTVKMTEFAKMPLLFAEDEGAENGFVDYTTQGIFKIDPLDPRLGAKHQITLGPTGRGKTFRKNRELALLNMMGVSTVSISSKEDDRRRTNILGGIHYDLSFDGTTKLPPFSMPERAREDDKQGKNLFYAGLSHMLDFLQTMTNNYDTNISYKYQCLLQDVFKTRDNASVSRIMEELKKMGLEKEAESIGRFSSKGLWGGLFDDEKETGYELDLYNSNIISISTKDIKNASNEAFELAHKVLGKKSIDHAARKKGTIGIFLDEVKDMLKDPRRAMQVASMFSEFRSFDAICSIYDQDGAFLEDGKIAKIIRTNAPRISILGIDEKDETTATMLGLTDVEEEICKSLKQKAGYWAEVYVVYKLNEQAFRQKVFSHTTPTEYAINTTEPKDCYAYDYIYERHYREESKDTRYAHIQSVFEFAAVFPHGVKQHPLWRTQRIRYKDNSVDFYRGLIERGEVKSAA